MTMTDETRERHSATPRPRPPYRAYAGIMGAFAGGLGLAGALARTLGRDPRDETALDLAVLSMAAF